MLTGDFNSNPDYIKGPDGKMQGSRPGKVTRIRGVVRLRGRVAHDLFSDHPKLPIGTKNFTYEHGDYFYVVDVVDWGEYDCKLRLDIEKDHDLIRAVKKRLGVRVKEE